MKSFELLPDCMGRPTSVVPQADNVQVVQLTAATTKSVTAPAGARVVLFSATAPFWARIGGAAVLPTGDNLTGNAPELNPAARTLNSEQTIGLVASTAATICLSFYA